MKDQREEALVIDDEDGIDIFWNARPTRYPSLSRNFSTSPASSPSTLAAFTPDPDFESFERLSIEPSIRRLSATIGHPASVTSDERKCRRPSPISIPDSEDEEEWRSLRQFSRPAPVPRAPRRENFIQIIAEDDEVESVLGSIEFGNDAVVIDLTEEDEIEADIIWEEEEAELRRLGAITNKEKYPMRNPAVKLPLVEIERCDWKGAILRNGKTVELKNGSFLRLKAIIENLSTGEILLRGWLLKRNIELDGLIPWQRNELCYIFEVDQDDLRPANEQCVEEVGLEDIARVRRIVFTNQAYPAFNNYEELREMARTTGKGWGKWVKEQEVLVVRWKSSPTFRNAQHRMKERKNPNSDHIMPKLEMLRQEECTPGKGLSAEELRLPFRGRTILGGSHKEFATQTQPTRGTQRDSGLRVRNHQPNRMLGPKTTFMTLDDDQGPVNRRLVRPNRNTAPSRLVREENRQRVRHFSNDNRIRLAAESIRPVVQRYDFGDWFCCSGGASSGASRFLQLRYGVDKDAQSGESFRANFPKARFYEMAVQDVFDHLSDTDRFRVDVAHGSTVCKTVSKAKTRPCNDPTVDIANRATLFTVKDMLLTSKPRIFTLEQADGFLNPKHRRAFTRVICQYTSLGFSVTWKIVPLEEWGLSQKRRRLIIIASCPGEDLPSFPPSTHSSNPGDGLKPLFTPKDALANIPRYASLQEPRYSNRQGQIYTPWDPRKLLGTITCAGTLCLPDGSKALTLRQIANLAGFPWYHEFRGQGIRGQIGNAFPPVCAGVLFEHVVRNLRRVDGIASAERRAERERAANIR